MIREIHGIQDERDLGRSRDWDFEGTWEELVHECRMDCEEFPETTGHIVEYLDSYPGGAQWQVWRVS